MPHERGKPGRMDGEYPLCSWCWRAQFAFEQRFSHRAAADIACANNKYVLDHYRFSSAGVKDAIPYIPGIVVACRDVASFEANNDTFNTLRLDSL